MKTMWRVPVVSILALVFLCFSGSALADLHKWTDEEGVLHFATSLEDVPEQYRSQVQTMKSDPAPAAAPQPPNEVPPAEAHAQPEIEESELARFEIPYENETGARRVIIPVKFNNSMTAPMALDTGSPGMVISLDLAVRLGVFSKDSGTLFTEVGGIGGESLGILTIIDSVSVEGARSVFVPTTVTAGLSPEFDGLIGMDFLANYTISIDTRKQVVVFQETPPDPEARGGHDEDWWRRTFEDFRAVSDRWRELAESASRRSETRSTPLVEFQAREAERLLKRLHLYASDNSVPRHWR